MMSSKHLIENLELLGYPGAQELTPRGLDWLFEDQALVPFLSWLSTSVGPGNVLTPEDKKNYAQMESTGFGILEGSSLEEALACLSTRDDDEIALEALRDEVEYLKEERDRLRARKERLVKTRNTFINHHTGLTHRLSNQDKWKNAKKHQVRKTVDKCHHSSVQVDASLQRLGESVEKLCSLLYTDTMQSEKKDREPLLLCHLSLDPFHRAEEQFSSQLTAFTKKLFFEGIADIAGGEVSRYQLLEVSDPQSLLIKAQSQKEFEMDCRELTRLRSVFAKSEQCRINARVQAQCAARMSAKADEILRQIETGQIPTDMQAITHQVADVKTLHSQLKGEVLTLTDKQGDLATLLKELATLQCSCVLTGDFNLKLARQDYFISNQDQVIKHLVSQRARNEFLSMAYEVESRSHHDIHCLFKAAHKLLNDRLTKFHARMESMDDPSLTKAKYERNTIDTCDVATTCLHQMLVTEDKSGSRSQALYLPYQSMVQAANDLTYTLDQVTSDNSATISHYQAKVDGLESETVRCGKALYRDSSTVGGQLSCVPRQVLDTLTELSDMCRKLELAIKDTVVMATERKKALKMDPLAVKERELFVHFHLNPDQLRQALDMLELRLQAHQIASTSSCT